MALTPTPKTSLGTACTLPKTFSRSKALAPRAAARSWTTRAVWRCTARAAAVFARGACMTVEPTPTRTCWLVHTTCCPNRACVRELAAVVFCDSLSMYGGSPEQFEQAHRQRVRPLLLQCVPQSLPFPCCCNIASRYLAGIPQAEQADVRLRRNINTRVCLCDIPHFFSAIV